MPSLLLALQGGYLHISPGALEQEEKAKQLSVQEPLHGDLLTGPIREVEFDQRSHGICSQPSSECLVLVGTQGFCMMSSVTKSVGSVLAV